ISRDARKECLIVETLCDEPCLFERRADGALLFLETVEGMREREAARLAAPLVMIPESSTEWAAGIGRAGGHPHMRIVGPFEDARIGDAVERDAARDHEMPRAIAGVESSCHVEHDLLDAHLEGARECLVVLADR